MTRRAYRVAYDGTTYRGFQRQPDVATVEDAVFDALRELDVLDAGAAKPAGYAAAGRTDAGVSARAQTVAFEAPDWLTPRAFNGELPADVRAWASADVPGEFHATHDADRRTYRYFLYAPPAGAGADAGFDDDPSTDADDRVDDERVRAALSRLAGEHDFHNLTPDESGTVRTLETDVERDGEFLVLTVSADGFARQLVRRLVGLVAAVGRGSAAEARVERILGPEPLDGPAGVAPAAPEPLVLWDVAYDRADFRVDEAAAASACEVWAERYRSRATGARVAGAVRDGLE